VFIPWQIFPWIKRPVVGWWGRDGDGDDGSPKAVLNTYRSEKFRKMMLAQLAFVSFCTFMGTAKFRDQYLQTVVYEPDSTEAYLLYMAFAYTRIKAGLYNLHTVDPGRLKAPGFNPWTYQVRTRFQSLLSNSTRTATPRAFTKISSW
jgi:hypothetical protein